MTILEKANAILAEKEAKLLPENIKSGVKIFDVEGTLIIPTNPFKRVSDTMTLDGITVYLNFGDPSVGMEYSHSVTLRADAAINRTVYLYLFDENGEILLDQNQVYNETKLEPCFSGILTTVLTGDINILRDAAYWMLGYGEATEPEIGDETTGEDV